MKMQRPEHGRETITATKKWCKNCCVAGTVADVGHIRALSRLTVSFYHSYDRTFLVGFDIYRTNPGVMRGTGACEMGKSRICFAFVERKFVKDAEHKWRIYLTMDIESRVLHTCLRIDSLRLRMEYVGSSSLDTCSTQTPSICRSSLGRVCEFPETPSARTGDEGNIPSIIVRFVLAPIVLRNTTASRFTVAVVLVTVTQQQWREPGEIDSAKPRKNSDALQASPCLREFRTRTSNDAFAHGLYTIHEAMAAGPKEDKPTLKTPTEMPVEPDEPTLAPCSCVRRLSPTQVRAYEKIATMGKDGTE
ncbi:hypothetical protein B0T20DRAFT_487054 [Sordaria brevicollis]|uniref:Uncharacterized protein n=1 Tax=Sordaria brevicollis TaxID=83679 RepID=A0AAE0P9P4_SORBR|nr:hypothetical protein B0T20DRAFT_487054 [Sordaria brevicollis]